MKFYSTKNKRNRVPLHEAVLRGMPSDKGLYMPEIIPKFPEDFFKSLSSLNFQEISFEAAKKFFSDDIPYGVLENIIHDAINFDAPLVNLTDKIKILELFHGPTLAFKDFGARFMSRLMSYLIKDYDKSLNIIVATSGDTGSAVANGFYNVPGINVVILYPSGKISEIQEKQITTLGGNITALEVDGNFDDCQRLSKQALADEDLSEKMLLTSANSINISRLIPQSFYYFYAYAQLKNAYGKKVVISVPSGNFGNLVGGLIAKKMGLPVHKFIIATNMNNVVPEYLGTCVYTPRASVQTISSAMDVGDPSNFARMLDMYDNSCRKMREDLCGNSFNDDQTRAAIKSVYERYGYILDPHGAVGYLGLFNMMNEHPGIDIGIFLETAHPAKFIGVVEPEINIKVTVPDRLSECFTRRKISESMSNKYKDLKEFLFSKYR
ncbi:MAG: threonine synthase [Candidatus Marinimicrobia bacterium]|nr:threonine synthase [Candidatus Neomarinimicrobiota bacterium]